MIIIWTFRQCLNSKWHDTSAILHLLFCKYFCTLRIHRWALYFQYQKEFRDNWLHLSVSHILCTQPTVLRSNAYQIFRWATLSIRETKLWVELNKLKKFSQKAISLNVFGYKQHHLRWKTKQTKHLCMPSLMIYTTFKKLLLLLIYRKLLEY